MIFPSFDPALFVVDAAAVVFAGLTSVPTPPVIAVFPVSIGAVSGPVPVPVVVITVVLAAKSSCCYLGPPSELIDVTLPVELLRLLFFAGTT